MLCEPSNAKQVLEYQIALISQFSANITSLTEEQLHSWNEYFATLHLASEQLRTLTNLFIVSDSIDPALTQEPAPNTESEHNNDTQDTQTPEIPWSDKVEGLWTSETAGGCMNNPTWRLNNQILLRVTQPGEVTLKLEQFPNENQKREGIGFYVLKGDNFRKLIIPNEGPVAKSAFSNSEFVLCTFTAEPSPNGYVVIPCTYYPNLEMRYTLSVHNPDDQSKPEIRAIGPNDQDQCIRLKSEWKGKSAGGCRNTPDWVYNPQFYLSVEQPSVVQFLLSQSAHQEFDAMGMYIFKAPEGPPQRCVPKELLTKSAFGSDQESSLIFEAQTNCIVIPCTFNPGKESPFLLSAYFNSPGVKLFEITENNEVFIDGEWSEQTAGGNTSSSTWRNNPQYRVYLDSPVDINLRLVQQTQEDFHPIGLFVFLDSGKRRLLVRPADVIATCNFTSLPAIDLKITKEQIQKLSKDKEEKFALTVMPCTYFPNLFGKFRLSVFSSGSTEVSEYQSVFRHIQHGAWTKESAGGCLNSGRTWRNNPQFQIVAKKKAKLLVLLHLPTQEEKKSIGFYILRGGSENQKILHLEDDSIVKKASFRKSHEAFCSLSVEKGERYNILPCTFLPGIQSEFSLIVFANEPDLIEFHPVEELAPTLCVSGCWEGVNAGGCMNNRSWCLNPRVALRVSNQPIRATIVLFQTSDAIKSGNLASLKAIGFNITRADESGDQIVQKPIDILASVPFEPAEDVSVTISLEPNENPYIITPATFYAHQDAEFEVLIFYAKVFEGSIELWNLPLPVASEDSSDDLGDNVSDFLSLSMTPEEIIKQLANDHKIPAELLAELNLSPEPAVPQPSPVIESTPAPNSVSVSVTEPSKPEIQIPNEPQVSPSIAVTPVALVEEKPTVLPPPPSVVKEVQDEDLPPVSGNSLLAQLQRGKLKRVSEGDKQTSFTRARSNLGNLGLNVERIISRRTALEYSDDEESNWSDHDDDDWW